jgi:hypothetical protein
MMKRKNLDRIINIIREQMVANAPGGSGGFSQSSDAAGPTAGYDPVMKKRQIKMPPGSRKKWLDHLRGKKGV